MKQLIIPIAIIVALIAFFVIIDRKEFSRHDDVQTVQSGNSTIKPTVSVPETKPVTDVKPTVEAKPIETKPVAETNPQTEAQPVAETKPAEVKPVETKPAETKPVAETKTDKPAETKPVAEAKPEEKVKPVAVPVVTAEEAEKLNEFAIFLSTAKWTIVEGEITDRSELPDPGKSDYPDCRYTAHFKGNAISFGEPCPNEISLIIEGFSNYKTLESNKIATGDKVECSIIPFDILPEEYKTTQHADDLNLFLLENYYVIDIRKINSFSDNSTIPQSGIYFSDGIDNYVSIFERHLNNAISQEVIMAQKESIQNDLAKINALLKGYDDKRIKEINSLFVEAWNEEKRKDPPDYNRIGNYVWRNINNSFWCLPEDYNVFIPQIEMLKEEILDSFTAFKRACESNGVQLLVVLIPDSYVVSSRIINSEFRDVPDLQMATYVKQLSQIGIESVYTTDAVIDNYNRFNFAYNYPSDPHPSDTVQDIISDLIAERVKRYDLGKILDSKLFSIIEEPPHHYRENMDYCFHSNCDIADHKDGQPYLSRKITFDNKIVPNTIDSPILLIGNSFIESPVYPSQSAPSLLSYKTHSPVNWRMYYALGCFSELLRQMLADPSQFLLNKKVVIYYFGAGHLKTLNRIGKMINIQDVDRDCILLKNRKICCSFSVASNIEKEDEKQLEKEIANLQNETVIKILQNGEWTQSFVLDNENVDFNKKAICVIPAAAGINTSIKLSVANQTEQMYSPSGYSNSRLYQHVFEIPAGVKEISVSAKGYNGSLFAIKNIQIWQ